MRSLFGLIVVVIGGLLVEPAFAASENARRDANRVPVSMGVTGDAAMERRMFRMDPNTGQLLVTFSRTWSGAKPEVYLVGVPFSVTIHGNVVASFELPFSQTIHGDVNATIVAVDFSQTMHGNITVISMPAITGTVDATIVHIPWSVTMHGSVVVTSLPAVTGTIDATIVHVPFSQTMHGNVIITSMPAITGAVNATIVHIPWSVTVHGNVNVLFQAPLDGSPPSRRSIIGGVEWEDGGSVRGAMIVDIKHLMTPTDVGPTSDTNEGAILVAAVPWYVVNDATFGVSRWAIGSATTFEMSNGEKGVAPFAKIVNSADQPIPMTGTVTGDVDATLTLLEPDGSKQPVSGTWFKDTGHGGEGFAQHVKVTPDHGMRRSMIRFLPPGERTNLALYSEELDQGGSWLLYEATLTADNTYGPNGLQTVERLNDSVADDAHVLYSNGAAGDITFTAGRPFCISASAKYNTGLDWFGVGASISGTDGEGTQWFNVKTGEMGHTAATASSSLFVTSEGTGIWPEGNGFYRCVACFNSDSDTVITADTSEATFAVSPTEPTLTAWWHTYAGNSGNMWLTNLQFEDDVSYSAGYIRTEGTAVTSGTRLLGSVAVSEIRLNAGSPDLTLGKRNNTLADATAWAPGLLAVRRDTPTPPSLNNYWYLIQGDALGRLWMNLDAIGFSVTTHGTLQGDITGAGKLLSWSFTSDGQGHVGPYVFPSGIRPSSSTYAVAVSNAAPVNLFPEALPGATSLMIQNLGTKAIFIGDVNVTIATGISVGNGGVFTLDYTNEALVWYAIGSIATTQDIRVGRW